MKKIILLSVLGLSLFAQEKNFFEVALGNKQSVDNFSNASAKSISSYTKANKDKSSLAYFRYSYTNGHFFSKTDSEDILTGLKYQNVEIGFLNSLKNFSDSTWKNPYSLNQNREETKISSFGLSSKYTFVKNKTNSSALQAKIYKTDVKDEQSISSLNRDAKRFELISTNRYQNILYNFAYINNDAKGEASSYKQYLATFGVILPLKKDLEFVSLISLGKQNYEKTNTVLNKKIDSDIRDFVTELTWKRLFSLKNKYLKLSYIKKIQDANHSFYDANSQLVSLNIGFKF